MHRKLLPVALATLLLSIPAIGMARRLSANTIDPTARIVEHGGAIALSGPITCTQVELVGMRVTVTQRTTGAIAEGYLVFIGTATQQHWQVNASVRGDADFEPGPAIATAIAVTSRNGQTTDAHQWLVPVQLQHE